MKSRSRYLVKKESRKMYMAVVKELLAFFAFFSLVILTLSIESWLDCLI